MKRPDQHDPRPRRRGRPLGRLAAVSTLTIALVGLLVAIALGSTRRATIDAASTRLGRVVVSPQGRTLYALRPETTHHLLCKSRECFRFWPPLTVASRKAKLKAGAGVHGRLGVLRRNGIFQVTLNGMPLYRYAGDHKKGDVNGQHIHSFGGVWHVISAAAGGGHSMTGTVTTTSSEAVPSTSSMQSSSSTTTMTTMTTMTQSSTSTSTSTSSTYKLPGY